MCAVNIFKKNFSILSLFTNSCPKTKARFMRAEIDAGCNWIVPTDYFGPLTYRSIIDPNQVRSAARTDIFFFRHVNRYIIAHWMTRFKMAEAVRFELTIRFRMPVFKTGALSRSATLPKKLKNRPCHFITQKHSKSKGTNKN